MGVLKLALRPLRLSFLSQLVAVASIGAVLSLAGLLYWLGSALEPRADELRRERVLTVYLAPEATAQQLGGVEDSIRLSLGAQAERRDIEVRPTSRDAFLGELRAHYPELSRQLESLGAEMKGVVPSFISISGVLPKGLEESLKSVSGVESVEASPSRNSRVVGAIRSFDGILSLLSIGLLLSVATILFQLARVNHGLHLDVAKQIRQWGGKSLQERGPVVLATVLGAIVGSSLGWIGLSVGSSAILRELGTLLPVFGELRPPPPELGLLMVSITTFAAMFLSWFQVRRSE